MPQPSDPAQVEMQLSPEATSVRTARDAIGAVALEVGADEEEVKLAVSEAVSNAVQHAFRGREPGKIGIRADTQGGTLVVTISDDGIGMSPRVDSDGLGLGIALITRVSHDVQIESTDA